MKNSLLSRPRQFKAGDLVIAAVHLTRVNTIETIIYPKDEKDNDKLFTFLSVCEDETCRFHDETSAPYYVYLNTLELGHVKTMTVWQFKTFRS